MDESKNFCPDTAEETEKMDNILDVKDDAEFEKRLAEYDGEGDKDYMRITRKRIVDAERAYELIKSAESNLVDAINCISEANTGTTRTRGLSLAITKVEEAIHWMDSVSYAIAPHDMNDSDPIGDIAESMNKNLNDK